MSYRVEVDREPRKFLRSRKVPAHVRLRVAEAIAELREDPRRGAKHLKGEYHCFWRRRVGDYRMVYRIFEKDKLVRVVEICLRETCY